MRHTQEAGSSRILKKIIFACIKYIIDFVEVYYIIYAYIFNKYDKRIFYI